MIQKSWWKPYRKLQRGPLPPVYALIIQPLTLPFLPIALKLPLHPHVWTALCLILKGLAGILILQGNYGFFVGLALVGAMICDGLDGAVARGKNLGSFAGAYLDRAVDVVGYAFILSCFVVTWAPLDLASPLFWLAAGLILGSIFHETTRVWVHITGGIFTKKYTPQWEQSLRDWGVLPHYAHDTFFLLLILTPLFATPIGSAAGIICLLLFSLGYQIWLFRKNCRLNSTEANGIWQQLLRRFGLRTAGAVIFAGAGWMISGPEASFFYAWVDFLGFYLVANWLMSLGADMPEHPEQKQQFIQRLQEKDEHFILRGYP